MDPEFMSTFWDGLPEVMFWISFVVFFLIVAFILEVRWRVNGGFSRRNCRHITTQLHGKTVIITGGNAGIGRETAIDLARRGARIIIGCRNAKKAEVAVKEIQRKSGSSNVAYRQLELSDQESVRTFAEVILEEEPKIYCLINNAGIGKAGKGHRTKEGYNMVFATNHFGPFLLTMLLLPRLKESAPSRIINVSSVAHTWVKHGEMYFTKTDSTGRVYPGLREYGRSKLANVLFAKELARRLQGTGVVAFALHPGVITSSILRTGYENTGGLFHWLVYCVTTTLMYLIGSNEEAGAQTTIYCAVEESIVKRSGRYFDNYCLAKETTVAADPALARKLWEVSCQATGLDDSF